MTGPQVPLGDIHTDQPLVLAVGWRAGMTVHGARLETTTGVAEEFRAICDAHLASLAARSPKAYSPEADLEPSEEYFVVPRAEFSDDDPVITTLSSAAQADSLTPSSLPSKPLLFYAPVFPDGVAFLRKANPHHTARPGRILTRLRNSLARIDDPVFGFDDKVDLVVHPDALLVSSVTPFEYLFKDEAFITAEIPAWIDRIGEHLPLADGAIDVLRERARTNSRMRRRLEMIQARGHLADVTMDDVRAEAKRQGLDPDEIVDDHGRLALTNISGDDLLRLLNEDLLTGGLSGERFTVERKSPR